VKSRFLLDVIVGESAAILELFTGEDETLLIWGNSLLVLDLGLDVLDGVAGLDLEGDGLTSQRLDEDLHTSAKAKHQVKSALLLDVVVGEGSSIFELLSSEDETLLIWRNSLLVLDLGLDVLDRVTGLNLEGDGLASQRLDENLHSSAKAKHQVKSALLLDVIVGEGSSIFQLLSSKDEPLLIWGNSLLVLDLGLDVLNAIGGLDLEGDGLPSEGLHEDLHTSSESQHKMEGRLLLDVVVRESSSVLKLLASEDQPLLIWWNAFLVLNLGLHILNRVRWLDLEGDSFPGKGLDEDLHDATFFVL